MAAENISILIIKNSEQSLRQAEIYLRNRKWSVTSLSSMRDALEKIIERRPQFILIAADHPNKKVKLLPRLLTQAFPATIIAYSESSSPAALSALRELNQPFQLFPPASGPAIERIVLRAKKEIEELNRTRADEARALEERATRASTDSTDVPMMTPEELTRSFEQARSTLREMAAKEAPSQSPEEELPELAEDPPTPFNMEEEPLAPGESFAEWEERVRRAIGGEKDPKNSPPPSEEPIDSGKKKKRPGTTYIDKKPVGTNSRGVSIFARGAGDALEEAAVEDPDLKEEDVQKIERATNAACIAIESPRFSGYLVAALGKNRTIDREFIDTVRTRLVAFLRANGEDPTEDESLNIKIEEIEFEDWALEQAEFLRKSIHHSDEVAMAFFPHNKVKVQVENSFSEKMVRLSIEDLANDIPLEFDVYIFLPENNKFLLYTPRGKPIYSHQKDRLKDRGVHHMHLRKEAVVDLKKYKAQNFLNEKIGQFKTSKTQKN